MKVAVVGLGIVGGTCAYYLSKEENIELKIFDYGVGQATKASAGIISPWFSKRRNKLWYKMARLGADFYEKLVNDISKDGFKTDFYDKCGVLLLKKDDNKLDDLFALAKKRREESPLIGELKILSSNEVKKIIPSFTDKKAIYASGGARLEGERLVKTLLKASGCEVIGKKVSLEIKNNEFYILGEKFDKVVVCVGAWLDEFLAPLGFDVDVRPQKGQLRDKKILDSRTEDYPVIMPEGELDIIPFEDGVISIGATHEDDKGFNLDVDKKQLDNFEHEARKIVKVIETGEIINERVGIRAYTRDYSPFYGEVKENKNLLVASGLGSSGLTTGAIIGYSLAMLVSGKKELLDSKNYPVENYVKLKK